MGECVFVVGKSGSGKSYSLRNFDSDSVGVFSVGGKRLPFKGGPSAFSLEDSAAKERYDVIKATLQSNRLNAYVVDDSTFLQTDEQLERTNDKDTFKVYREIGVHLAQLINVAKRTSPDTLVYFLHHVDYDERGNEKIRSIGKMIDEKYNPVERCNVVLDCVSRGKDHLFITNADDSSLAKSPPGMFEGNEIPNDLALVDTAIREFWGMKPLKKSDKPTKEVEC